MKYVVIEKYRAEFSIKAMCRVLRVASAPRGLLTVKTGLKPLLVIYGMQSDEVRSLHLMPGVVYRSPLRRFSLFH